MQFLRITSKTRWLVTGVALTGALLSAACGSGAEKPVVTSMSSTPAAAATVAATATSTPTVSAATIAIKGAWARSTPGNPNESSAGYGVLTNAGKEADKLVSASVDAKVAEKVELHRTVRVGEQMKMEPVPFFELAANGGTLTLEPGGNHIMLLNLPTAMKAGTKVPVTLRFERAGTMTMDFEVREATGGTPAAGMGGMGSR